MPCPTTPQSLRAKLRQLERRNTVKSGDAQGDATLSEVFPTRATDAAGPGFVLAHLPRDTGPILWVQDRLSLREAGRPYLAGLADPPELLCLTVSRAVDVLWAMEQGLGCGAIAAVVGEVWGDAPALDFTATKRLALRSEAHAIPGWLLRRSASPDLSAARDRWRVGSVPSELHPHNPRAPGIARWQAELFRSRRQTPGSWVVSHDTATHTLHFAPSAPPQQAAPITAQA